MAAPSPWIVETSEATFQQDVLERSMDVPVVVDFWAAWCQPCRMLGPILEKLSTEYAGKFVLVKADTDQMPNIAGAFGVQSIPAVFAVRNGEIVDQFVGVAPEAQLRQWLDRIVPGEADNLASEAEKREVVDPQAAESLYRQAIEANPSDPTLEIGLARSLRNQDRIDEARQIVERLAEAGLLDAEGERLRAELDVVAESAAGGGLEAARRAAEASPNDLSAQLQLARALAAAGEHAPAMDICLRVIEKDRAGQGETARELIVQIFHLLGSDNPLVADYRRRLTMLLY